jgi:hypothetical protein
MPNSAKFSAGDSISKTLTFTLAAGEEASRITLLLTRTDAHSEHPAIGRARCLVLEADDPSPCVSPGATVATLPRARCQAELRGVIPASICGGSYTPVFCVFAYVDGRSPTGFEIDADQRFTIEIADDAAAVDSGPSISAFA